MKRSAFFVFIIFLSMSPPAFAASPAYGVSQNENLVFVKTPWGSSIYIAPVGFNSYKSYAFEIPLDDLKPGNSGSRGARDEAGKGKNGESAVDSSAPLGDISSLITNANRLYNSGQFDRALTYVEEAARRDPKNVRVWIMKGSLMHALGHDDLAKQSWQKALGLDPSNERIKDILKGLK